MKITGIMNTLLIILLFFILLILIWALRGSRDETKGKPEKEHPEDTPENILRRRSRDREIEESYPAQSEPEKNERHEKVDHEDPHRDSNKGLYGEITLPYPADLIISDRSRFRVYKRTLFNSEIYAQKGEIKTAISLYEGVFNRINDSEVRYKIETNIDYLKNFKKRIDEGARKTLDEEKQKVPGQGDIKVKIDGQLPSTINIGLMGMDKVLDADSIATKVTSRIKDDIEIFKTEIDKLKKIGEKIRNDDGSPKDSESLSNEIIELRNEISILAGQKEKINSEIAELKSLKSANDGSISDELSGLKNEINGLSTRIDEIILAPEQQKKPMLIEARYDSPVPVRIDPQPILDILKNLPKIEVPRETAVQKPKQEKNDDISGKPDQSLSQDAANPFQGDSRKETVKEIHTDNEDDEFELLNQIGKQKEMDVPSDDEIFEKILKDAKKDREENQFEILGEKHDESEYGYSNFDGDEHRKEDERFYKNLLKTNKALKKELPILRVSYDFTRLPDDFSLSKEKNILEYSFYKYKPMLEKADEYLKKRKVKDAINYYKVVLAQNIPVEFKKMIQKNITDLTDYLEKYLSAG